MTELYWLTRLDAIDGTLTFIFILSLLCVTACIIVYASNIDEGYSESDRKQARLLRMNSRKIAKVSLVAFAISVILDIFLPSTKEAFVIYGVGGTLDYIKQDSTLQAMPKKVIDACDSYLNDVLKDKED